MWAIIESKYFQNYHSKSFFIRYPKLQRKNLEFLFQISIKQSIMIQILIDKDGLIETILKRNTVHRPHGSLMLMRLAWTNWKSNRNIFWIICFRNKMPRKTSFLTIDCVCYWWMLEAQRSRKNNKLKFCYFDQVFNLNFPKIISFANRQKGRPKSHFFFTYQLLFLH